MDTQTHHSQTETNCEYRRWTKIKPIEDRESEKMYTMTQPNLRQNQTIKGYNGRSLKYKRDDGHRKLLKCDKFCKKGHF